MKELKDCRTTSHNVRKRLLRYHCPECEGEVRQNHAESNFEGGEQTQVFECNLCNWRVVNASRFPDFKAMDVPEEITEVEISKDNWTRTDKLYGG